MPVVTDKPARHAYRQATSRQRNWKKRQRANKNREHALGAAGQGLENSSTKRGGWLVIRHSTVRTAPLKAFLPVDARPINLVVFQGSFVFRQANLISGGASRLDAFSVYPCRT